MTKIPISATIEAWIIKKVKADYGTNLSAAIQSILIEHYRKDPEERLQRLNARKERIEREIGLTLQAIAEKQRPATRLDNSYIHYTAVKTHSLRDLRARRREVK